MSKIILTIIISLNILFYQSSFLQAKSKAIDSKTRVKRSKVYVVDDFEYNPKKRVVTDWWSFGKLKKSWIDNGVFIEPFLGKRSLRLSGSTKQWLVGGIGTYLGVNAKRFNAIKMVIHGSGKKSGMLVIELYDDDNNNWEIELNPDDSSRAYTDDKFVYTVKVDWSGWKVLVIPFKKFIDDNIKIGDDIWNPNQEGRSGGLVQMQILALSSGKKGDVRIGIDSIKFFKMPKKR
ncbi:hypothetical protein ACFLZV_02415 [Candidatus Margulisiibacteriota bacterium]